MSQPETNSRIQVLQRMLEARPDDPRARFGLALEFERMGRWEAVVEQLRAYLGLAQDEGNAYGRLAHALHQLGRDDEARASYRQGIETALRHGHPTMAEEFEAALDDL